ncbi:hypothetical protein OJF2_03970 [Aquisphaera giovannonii]|uniref:Large ribosomal subunit protein bL12 C-terminal domain-containing protein n=1 Tax=Aquisphaera giovannonii TaxID=406548 RepID=A0A5B9VW34_9BACT|nr:ribosomal protein L7/L12 [Aquisphaera giovannonii]QEH31930.1 hypothetical protein OJF2_03970 [Aquisphaera giovannonii]
MLDLFTGGREFTADDAARLRRVERKLDLIMEKLAIDYDEGDFPEPARSLAASGEKIAAIKAYRAATGAGLAEAKRAVEEFMGRRPNG